LYHEEDGMRVTVNLDLCQAYANCLLAAPDVFDLDPSESYAVMLQASPDPALRDDVEAAVRACPVRAIVVTE